MARANKLKRLQLSHLWVIHKKSKCERCGTDDCTRDSDGYILRRKNLTVHHLDGNIENNDPSNHQTLCRKCHIEIENLPSNQ